MKIWLSEWPPVARTYYFQEKNSHLSWHQEDYNVQALCCRVDNASKSSQWKSFYKLKKYFWKKKKSSNFTITGVWAFSSLQMDVTTSIPEGIV